MFSKHSLIAYAKGFGTLFLIFGFLAGFMTLNALHWSGAI